MNRMSTRMTTNVLDLSSYSVTTVKIKKILTRCTDRQTELP